MQEGIGTIGFAVVDDCDQVLANLGEGYHNSVYRSILQCWRRPSKSNDEVNLQPIRRKPSTRNHAGAKLKAILNVHGKSDHRKASEREGRKSYLTCDRLTASSAFCLFFGFRNHVPQLFSTAAHFLGQRRNRRILRLMMLAPFIDHPSGSFEELYWELCMPDFLLFFVHDFCLLKTRDGREH